MLNVVYNQHF